MAIKSFFKHLAHFLTFFFSATTRAKVQSFLDVFFTPFRVKWGGMVLSLILGGLLLHGGCRIGFFIAQTVVAVSFVWPHQLWHWLSNFADEVNWPPFVAIGVSIIFIVLQGGHAAAWTLWGPLSTLDGQYFDENY